MTRCTCRTGSTSRTHGGGPRFSKDGSSGPRIDVFLNYWVVMATADEVQTQDVFKEFKKLVESGSRDIVEIAGDLEHCARLHRRFDTFLPTSTEGTFMYRWRTVDAGASTPVVLWLFAQPASALTAEERNETPPCSRAFSSVACCAG